MKLEKIGINSNSSFHWRLGWYAKYVLCNGIKETGINRC